jgi:hypothetical protein
MSAYEFLSRFNCFSGKSLAALINVGCSGCGSVRLEHTVRNREIGGSNPLAPTLLFKIPLSDLSFTTFWHFANPLAPTLVEETFEESKVFLFNGGMVNGLIGLWCIHPKNTGAGSERTLRLTWPV